MTRRSHAEEEFLRRLKTRGIALVLLVALLFGFVSCTVWLVS